MCAQQTCCLSATGLLEGVDSIAIPGSWKMRVANYMLAVTLFLALMIAILNFRAMKSGVQEQQTLEQHVFQQRKLRKNLELSQPQSIGQLESIKLSDGGALFWGQEHAPTSKGQHLLYPMRKILNTFSIAEALNDDEVDLDYERERCAKYGFELGNRTSRRRIFWGTNIADESFRVLQAVATEVYDILDTVSFIESNRSAALIPRKWRWLPGADGLEALRSAFGPKTRVTVDYYVDGPVLAERGGVLNHLHREHRQRQNILERWHRNGMRPDDIGIIGDTDEGFFRDFLRALQICDVPEFRKNQDCKEPKIVAAGLTFESSPECVCSDRVLWHPDAIIGECLEKIGDERIHPPPRRSFNDVHSFRAEGYGLDNNYSAYFEENSIEGNMYPLWNPADIRRVEGGRMVKHKETTYTAFHLHNNFLTSREIRNKYTKYAEKLERANTVPLMLIHEDVGLAVSCVHNLTWTGKQKTLLNGGYSSIRATRPLLYHNDEFRSLRHQEALNLVLEDERRYGAVTNVSCSGARCDTCNQNTCDGYEHRDTQVFQILKDIDNTDDAEFLREYIEKLQHDLASARRALRLDKIE